MAGEYLDPSQWPLWMQSGSMGPIPGSPPAQQMPGQGLRDSVQPMVDQVMANRQKGIFDRLGEMFARRDDQGAPQAPGAWDYVNAAMWAVPGARGIIRPEPFQRPPAAANFNRSPEGMARDKIRQELLGGKARYEAQLKAQFGEPVKLDGATLEEGIRRRLANSEALANGAQPSATLPR